MTPTAARRSSPLTALRPAIVSARTFESAPSRLAQALQNLVAAQDEPSGHGKADSRGCDNPDDRFGKAVAVKKLDPRWQIEPDRKAQKDRQRVR